MLLIGYLWLLLCYAQNARSNLLEDYEGISRHFLLPETRVGEPLPVELGVDRYSGCICRASRDRQLVVCFGNYECRRFPQVKLRSEILRVRTTVMLKILRGQLNNLQYLKILEIEANHKLQYLEPGIFENLKNLQHLSISYNTQLCSINERLFEGLTNLRNLTLVNNGFHNILALTPAFRPSILPSLRWLDVSENPLEVIPENAFYPMSGTLLRKLDVNLCRLDEIHPNSFNILKNLKELHLGDNDLNATLIGDFLIRMIEVGINLTNLDLSGMGFRKQPPRELMKIIAKSTVKSLVLSQNQFEIIHDDTFPKMVNIELLDLRKVLCISIGGNAFNPTKFPNLKVLLLGGNNLPGIHSKHLSDQLLLLDISSNKGNPANPVYYEIDRDTFLQCKELRILNLSFNRIKSIFDYTFTGLVNLRMLSLENGTIYHIGDGTFKSMKKLEVLNLANNPLTANENLTSSQYEGLNELKILNMQNCGIRHFYEDDNIFETMPNLTHLILKNNLLYFITAETLKPLKLLTVLDLSENLLVSWWRPLFLESGVKPLKLYFTNNKISHFSISMIQDLSYLLETKNNETVEIDFMDNVFLCDCSAMYKTYLWLQANGTTSLKNFFDHSKFQCSSPDLWEDRRVAEYLSSIRNLRCLVYHQISNLMVLVWTAPSLVSIMLVAIVVIILYKYRIYIRYWIFLAKLALGRNLIKKSLTASQSIPRGYKFDAFVSYCNEDREFVSEMLVQLESHPSNLKLCVYERDFEIGSFISESVLTCINESKYVILIISNNFAKSQWCRWETQLAEYHRLFLEDGTAYDPLVLVKIGNIESKYLTTTLKYLLKTKVYHSWDENNAEDFWKKLRNVLAKQI
ncbi:toll-like receptor 2 [Ostrinia furnacalis]|uniref:toll-like receptor 2 n=1 Tax=Ostrinia furnacalis TaxID=93504 RepID=UPI0010409003|nr:toll-like receptor 2 [Ostrinia furnacalis]